MPNKAQYAKLRRRGLCTACNKKNDSASVRCKSCSAKMAAYSRAQRARLIKSGRCHRCGRKLSGDDNLLSCPSCTLYRHSILFGLFPSELNIH